jgi:putative addiction module killer protein
MVDVRRTPEFDKWLNGLRDTKARANVLSRIDRLILGNPGDVKPAGEGVSEMRIDHGPGYRVYYKSKGDVATLLFGATREHRTRT